MPPEKLCKDRGAIKGSLPTKHSRAFDGPSRKQGRERHSRQGGLAPPAMEQPRQDGLVPCIILQALWGVFLDKYSLTKL